MIDELQTLVVIPEQNEEAGVDGGEEGIRPSNNSDDGEESASSGEILYFNQWTFLKPNLLNLF